MTLESQPQSEQGLLPPCLNPFLGEDWVPVATVQAAHGLKGAFKAKTNDEFPDWLDGLETIQLWPYAVPLQRKHVGGQTLKVTYAKQHAPYRVVMLTDLVHTPEAVKAWEKSTLYIPKAALPPVREADTWREMDLVGCQVQTAESQQLIGVLEAIVSTTSNAAGADHDFLEVRLQPSGKTSLIPFTKHFVSKVSIADRLIEVQGLEAFLLEEATPAVKKEPKRPPRKKKPKLDA